MNTAREQLQEREDRRLDDDDVNSFSLTVLGDAHQYSRLRSVHMRIVTVMEARYSRSVRIDLADD